jgi:hypothetical protein
MPQPMRDFGFYKRDVKVYESTFIVDQYRSVSFEKTPTSRPSPCQIIAGAPQLSRLEAEV